MSHRTYTASTGGHPAQTELMPNRSIFTEAYAFIPRTVQRDIVTSRLPHWRDTRVWTLARPLSGFAESFSQYLMEVGPGGGSNQPEPSLEAEAILFIVEGEITITMDGEANKMTPGGYAFIPPATIWSAINTSEDVCRFYWIRKAYEEVEGIDVPQAFFTHDKDVEPTHMPDTNGVWATSRFVDPDDVRHDMHLNIVTFQPGGVIPFEETHVMEHGITVIQGKAVYKLNQDWIEVEAGDFMWLRAFCPQACYAAGPEPFRYLLYKDVNRHMAL